MEYDVDVAVISKSEHADSCVSINGYTLFRRDRARREGSGVEHELTAVTQRPISHKMGLGHFRGESLSNSVQLSMTCLIYDGHSRTMHSLQQQCDIASINT